jgi:hypothetical protein
VPQVRRRRQAQLRVMQVVSRISHVINRTDAHYAWIFHAASAFVWRGGLQYRPAIDLEVQAIPGFRVADTRHAVRIARAE